MFGNLRLAAFHDVFHIPPEEVVGPQALIDLVDEVDVLVAGLMSMLEAEYNEQIQHSNQKRS